MKISAQWTIVILVGIIALWCLVMKRSERENMSGFGVITALSANPMVYNPGNPAIGQSSFYEVPGYVTI